VQDGLVGGGRSVQAEHTTPLLLIEKKTGNERGREGGYDMRCLYKSASLRLRALRMDGRRAVGAKYTTLSYCVACSNTIEKPATIFTFNTLLSRCSRACRSPFPGLILERPAGSRGALRHTALRYLDCTALNPFVPRCLTYMYSHTTPLHPHLCSVNILIPLLPTTTSSSSYRAPPPLHLHLPHPHHDHVVGRAPGQSSSLGRGTLEYTGHRLHRLPS